MLVSKNDISLSIEIPATAPETEPTKAQNYDALYSLNNKDIVFRESCAGNPWRNVRTHHTKKDKTEALPSSFLAVRTLYKASFHIVA